MVVQNKETKTSSSLIDLLSTNNMKTKTSQGGNEPFARLLASLNTTPNDSKTFGVIVESKSTPKQPDSAIKNGETSKTPEVPQVKTVHSLKTSRSLPENTLTAAPTTSSKTEEVNLSTIITATSSRKASATNEKQKAELIIPAEIKQLETILETEETKLLPKELLTLLSNDQVHSLIHKAKEFLKESITTSSPEYKHDPKALPKTLMGLVELADKIGINLSEITLTALDDAEQPLTKELPIALASKSFLELKQPTAPTTEIPIKTFEALSALLSEAQHELKPKKEEEKGTKSLQQPLQTLLKSLNDTESNTQKEVVKETAKEGIKSIPLQSSSTDLLSTLLRSAPEGEKVESKEGIKPQQESSKTITTPKIDSIEVKSKEATQGLRHFAIDLKEAAENYKPPFTRVSMKLNPEKLGEVEVTLVQRGNNVHVNIQSNNASSVAFLAHNATELKAQLAQQGITNATMNFMSGGEQQSQNPNHQQHQQPNRFHVYESLQELESAQQELSALEIILPHYA